MKNGSRTCKKGIVENPARTWGADPGRVVTTQKKKKRGVSAELKKTAADRATVK